MNETIIPYKSRHNSTQCRPIDFDLYTSFLENHFLQLLKYDCVPSQSLIETDVATGNFSLVFEEPKTTTTKDFTDN